MSISRALAETALNTDGADIPASAREAAAKMLLDTIGSALAGARAPGVPEVLELEREIGGVGQATVLFYGDRLALSSAAFVNSVITHAMDYDDCFPGADLHIMSIVVPSALAAAEMDKRNGRDALDAIILGVEVAGRIGKAYMRAKRPHGYFLTSSLIGGYGAVAAAGRLLGVSVEEMVSAFGIMYAQACGNRLALVERKLTKRIQPALAAKAGVYSVQLARKGFTGPEHVFEGRAGLFKLYTESDDPEEAEFARPEESWGIEQLRVKRFPTCGCHHAAIAAARDLHREHALPCADIESVEIYIGEGGNYLVGMPFEAGLNPQVDAQFCAPYAVALALARGDASVGRFSDDAIRSDTDTADLAARTTIIKHWRDFRSPDHPDKPPTGEQFIRLHLRNGQLIEASTTQAQARSPATATQDEVIDKFRECASSFGGLSDDSIDDLIRSVLEFERVEAVGEWMEGLAFGV